MISKYIDSDNFPLTLRECDTLFNLAIEIELCETKITCNYDSVSTCKHTFDRFLFNARYSFDNQFIFFVYG